MLEQQQIAIFTSLFKGREDVFAIRWEKNNKAGYMPAYLYDPYRYRVHKIHGGTFQNFNEKTYLKLTETEIKKHLNGIHQIGIYPLLINNTSNFIVADFDKENWKTESASFLNICKQKNIPAYLERSRSGNGGHVWIFFEQPYFAIKSRNIFIDLLTQSGTFSIFDKSSSFDRLFPNQDMLSGKGLGNLIALPLCKTSLEIGNNCFIDPVTFEPIKDQWAFLENIQRVSINVLDILYNDLTNKVSSKPLHQNNGPIEISLSNQVNISKSGLTLPLINYLKEELNFSNTAYFIQKSMGKNTFGKESYFKQVVETENEVVIPRGFLGKLLRFCIEKQIEYQFIDERKLKHNIPYTFNANLLKHQKAILDIVSKKDFGVIVAPTGSGKTVIGLKIIATKQQPALIIVHRKQLLAQWVERIEAFLGIAKKDIGIIGQGKVKIGQQITVATIQSIPNQLEVLQQYFGTIIVDECHHIPAETFRNTIAKLNTFYLYGLTATPFRKYNDGKLIFTHLGEVIANIQKDDIEDYKEAKIIIRNTSFDVPFNIKTDQFETLSKILIHDSQRNKQILDDVALELKSSKKIVIITERKEHIETLYLFLKKSYETITLSGEDSESNRKMKWKILKDGNFQILITTGQYFGEGTDLNHINILFLVYPFSFQGKLIQYIGRVQRSEISPTIYDYHDSKIDYLDKLFLKRNTYYRKITKQATLFDEQKEESNGTSANKFTFSKVIKISIDELTFHYGNISFKYKVNEVNTLLEFEIENIEIRPEFEVLKKYFVKVFKSKFISVDVFAEFENGKIVSQLANSADINRINKEVIEGVKFQFLNKEILGNNSNFVENIISSEALHSNQLIFEDANSILDTILKNNHYKHTAHIQYLSILHDYDIMKIRFVLNPFSFVFLVEGDKQYHFILETLDTEEATYIWHITKNIAILKDTVNLIDQQINNIRDKGRQYFLENKPENFSRILHDYAKNNQGFITWKGLLDERLY